MNLGTLDNEGESYTINAADSQVLVYSIPVKASIEAGKSAEIFIDFVEESALEAVTEGERISSYILKNGFNTKVVSVSEVNAAKIDQLEKNDVSAAFISEGLVFHFDTSADDSLYLDAGCSAPATKNGELVACWRDLVGTNNVSQTQGEGRMPAISVGAVGARTGLIFDGDGDRLDWDIILPEALVSHTAVAIGVFSDMQNNYRFFTFGQESLNRHIGIGVEDSYFTNSFFQNNILYGPASVQTTQVIISSFTGEESANGSSRRLFINGAEQAPSRAGADTSDFILPRESKACHWW